MIIKRTFTREEWEALFEAVRLGRKTHEARQNDRGFEVGHTLRLREWSPNAPDTCSWDAGERFGEYTGRSLDATITHITQDKYGLPPTLAIMSIWCSEVEIPF